MDVKSGATVGFATAGGMLAGAMTGYFVGELFQAKRPEVIAIMTAFAGGLAGAFAIGTYVSPDATTATAPAAITASGTGSPRGMTAVAPTFRLPPAVVDAQ